MSTNLFQYELAVTCDDRVRLIGQRPFVIWFTGISGAGKTTVANKLDKLLCAHKKHTYLLDGDNVRNGLCSDLGFTPEGRSENIRRVGEVSKLMCESGLIVITALISPYKKDRKLVRSLFDTGHFIEVYLETSIEIAAARDHKGLYEKAKNGTLNEFTGFDSDYEPPEKPELRIETEMYDPNESAKYIFSYLETRNLI